MEVKEITEKLKAKTKEHGIRISASCGYYVTSMDSETDIDSVIRKADEEMYLNKSKKR